MPSPAMSTRWQRRLPVGAEPLPDGGVEFKVWAPGHAHLDVVLEDGTQAAMSRDAAGKFAVVVPTAATGMRYRFRLPDARLLPDPASRFQPDGPHGPSMVVDADTFAWSDSGWSGPAEARQVIYEMHVGTFTQEGSWSAATERLPDLSLLGITIIELMPVAEFPGRFNWGYDGVSLFAPAHVYGTPDEMRRFVDRAHALGIGVALDVVYNHAGPDGCYLRDYAEEYFSKRYSTDWGEALNFDDRGSEQVREFFLANVEHWIREYHLDGLRIDATQNIYDAGPRHILTAITDRARASAAPRRVWIVAENEPQNVTLLEAADEGGMGMDALWNDDFHHTARVALTGRAEAYYTDYNGSAQELISAAKFGFLFQGQYYAWQQQRRGTPALHVDARSIVNYLQNHDQVANSVDGARLHALTSPGEYRAMTALLLLMPGNAMLFQGQEFGSSRPFLFFADHEPALAAKVYAGRREFLKQFESTALPEMQRLIDDPADELTFEQCRLDHRERRMHEPLLRLHTDLIRLSRLDPAFALQDASLLHGAVLGPRAFALRYVHPTGDDRLLIVNLGEDLEAPSIPEPLLAPPSGCTWALLWSSEDPAYGGRGAAHPESAAGWDIAGRAAVVLAPRKETGAWTR